MQDKKIRFDNDAGHSLAGLMALPENEPRAYALFAHCFTCNKDIFAAARIASSLAEHGIAVRKPAEPPDNVHVLQRRLVIVSAGVLTAQIDTVFLRGAGVGSRVRKTP